ncbi:MAG: HEAT repeat domain-containing protein [Bacteroidota bacterium]
MTVEDQLVDYIAGNLPPEAAKKVATALENDPVLQQEMEALRVVMTAIDEAKLEEVPGKVKNNFYAFLEEEQAAQLHKVVPMRRRWYEWAAAAAVALVLLGTSMGLLWQNNQQQQAQIDVLLAEVEQTQKLLILSMLEQPSASERIKAVNTVPAKVADPQIIGALIQRLEEDDNVNVQLKAAEALANFTNQEYVVAALTTALGRESQPELQIALIDILVEIGAKGAFKTLEELTEKEDVIDVVKAKAADGMGQLI